MEGMNINMKIRAKRAKFEMLAIYIVAILLVISVAGLAGRVVSARSNETAKAIANEKYPNLYAPAIKGDITNPDKTVYFTFDDGPSKNTEKLLDILKEERVKATFFVTIQLEDTEYAINMLKRIVDEGHTIGLHSYTHDFGKIYKNSDAYLADINKLNDFIIEHTGYQPTILRFPGGSRTANCKRDTMDAIITEITRRGYVYYDWDVVSGDDSTVYPAEHLSGTVLRGMKNLDSAVILAHDSGLQKTTSEATRLIIEELREQGFTFDKLTANIEPRHLK